MGTMIAGNASLLLLTVFVGVPVLLVGILIVVKKTLDAIF